MSVLITHDLQSAKNLIHSFKRNKKNLKINQILLKEFINWLYDNNFSITQTSK